MDQNFIYLVTYQPGIVEIYKDMYLALVTEKL